MSTSCLSSLPDELLAQILACDMCPRVFDLWKCGDSLLNMKLARGGVREVMMRDDVETSWTRWPKMLSKFRSLRKLVIVRTELRLDSVENVRFGLQQLSPTLEHLELSFIYALEALYRPEFIEPPQKNKDTPPLWRDSTELRLYPSYSRIQPDKTGLWDLKTTFPSLTTLIVTPQRESYENPSVFQPLFCDLDFLGLPESLTHLELRSNAVVPAPVFGRRWNLKWLPRGLTTLVMQFMPQPAPGNFSGFHFSPDELKELPQSLTHLNTISLSTLDHHQNRHSPEEIINSLPPSLTVLPLPGWTKEFPLIPHLQSFSLPAAHEFDDFFPILPRFLSTLSIPKFVTNLPTSITKLTLRKPVNWDRYISPHGSSDQDPKLDTKTSLFPPALKELIVEDGSLPHGVFEYLPSTLLRLDAWMPLENPPTTPLNLPTSLTNFKWLPQGELWLPPTPLSAQMLTHLPISLQIAEVCISSVPDEFAEGLKALSSRKLTRLEVVLPVRRVQIPLDDTHFMHLPKSLTQLKFSNISTDFTYWKILPQTLTSLSHSGAVFARTISDGMFGWLPSSLIELSCGDLMCHGDQLQYLPRGLRTFYSFYKPMRVSHFSSQHCSELPPKLVVIHLDIDFNTHHLVEEDIFKLPKTLHQTRCLFGNPLDTWLIENRKKIYLTPK